MTGTAVATTEAPKPRSVIASMATRYGMEPAAFEATVRATCMPQGRDLQPMTREEFAAGIMVAEKYTLNPILREIYFYPRRGGGIVPVVSIDGWLSLINRRKELDGVEFDEAHDEAGNLISVTCRIYRNDRKHPTIVTEYLSECVRDTPPWKMKHRMLRHKSMIQCARYAFGFAGIHDEDEAERIVEATAQIPGPAAPPPPPAEVRPLEPSPPANANTGPAAPPVEEAEIVEASSPAQGGGAEEHPPLAQEDPFDPEAWLEEARDRFREAQTPADVDDVHETFGDTANELLGITDRQKYQDMHEAAVLRTATQGKPEQAEVTGEPGPAPIEDDEDDLQFPGEASIVTPPAKTPGEVYLARIRAAIADHGRTLDSLSGLWKATKGDRQELVRDGHLTREQAKELQAELLTRWPAEAKAGQEQAQPGPTAPPAEEDPAAVYDREFRAKVAACNTTEEIGALSAGTLAERGKFAGDPLQKVWTTLVADRRKQISGIA